MKKTEPILESYIFPTRFFMTLFQFVIVAILGGCANIGYNLAMENIGSKDMRNVKMVMDEYYFGIGWLSPGQSKVHSRPDIPLGKNVDLYWQRDNEAAKYQSTVDIESDFPPLKPYEWYEITFYVDDTNEATFGIRVCDPYEGCRKVTKN